MLIKNLSCAENFMYSFGNSIVMIIIAPALPPKQFLMLNLEMIRAVPFRESVRNSPVLGVVWHIHS